RLSTATAAKIFIPILDALTMAHDHGIVHRDVTPNNILLAEQTAGGIVPKLTDFGIARQMAIESTRRITEDGTLLGTPLFMSPEQVIARPDVDGRSDVWSVGACLYLAVTGKVPFSAKSLVELAAQIIMAPAKKPSERRTSISPELEAIILRALEKDPVDRYPTARAFRDALRELAMDARKQRDSVGPDDARMANLLDTAPQSALTPAITPEPQRGVADVGSLRAASRARPLRVGMVVRNAEAHARVEAAFADALGIRCDVWCYFDYSELVDALSERDIEFAWLPPVAYVRAKRAHTARLLLTVERSGRSTYAAALLARKGAYERLEDIERARAVWVDPWSAAGYMMPLALLRARGFDPAEIFSSQAFLRSHDAVLDALVARSADIGATHCTFDDQGVITRCSWEEGEVDVLAVSEPIPGDTFCSAPGVSKNLRRMVCQALLDVTRSSPVLATLGASRLVPGDIDAYVQLERALMEGR
ncbi:MAG: PhnD/SsuA/transferrin family substrate-binding protein, partial [Myxococcota bacterium]